MPCQERCRWVDGYDARAADVAIAAAPPAQTLTGELRAGLPTVRIEIPPGGFAIYHVSPALHRFGSHPPQDLKPWTESTWHGAIRKN